jgi:hypothetical protein
MLYLVQIYMVIELQGVSLPSQSGNRNWHVCTRAQIVCGFSFVRNYGILVKVKWTASEEKMFKILTLCNTLTFFLVFLNLLDILKTQHQKNTFSVTINPNESP